ncbi:LacI family DNA-binding transcriptional regulator [soil metagenome]
MKRVTLRDVATDAGVSYQTVSNVLNAPDRVRENTRERVREAVQRLGYTPHVPARELRERATRTIAYVAPTVVFGAVSPLLDEFLHHLCAAAERHGQRILLITDLPGVSAEQQVEDLISTGEAAGAVLSQTSSGDPRIAALIDVGVPLVTFGQTELEGHDWVDVDGAAGTRAAVEHLLAAGRRRLAYLGFEQPSLTGQHRLQGFEGACARAELSPVGMVELPDDVDRAAATAAGWLSSDGRPDAIVAASDTLAAGVVRAAASLGMRVGHDADVSVTGFDDSPVAALLTPTLTSLRQPLEAVTTELVDLLVARVKGRATRQRGVLLTPDLVLRESA